MRLQWAYNRITILLLAQFCAVQAQSIAIQPVDPADFSGLVDSNSPSYWWGGKQYLFNSVDLPVRSEVDSPIAFRRSRAVFVEGANTYRWIEAAWADTDGTVYAWYHAEPSSVCPGRNLTAPQIGALVSADGVTFADRGIILKDGGPLNCDTADRYFAGGHGDFSVIPDRAGRFFYFLFTNYGGPAESQGVAVARMEFEARDYPLGRVWKFFQGGWTESGVGGRVTPIFPALANWSSGSPDSFWGPAVHWNTALEEYVVLMNHVAGDQLWNQEGIYVSVNSDISNPSAWTTPVKLADGDGWYPQVLGYGPGETDTLVGARARLFVMGHSDYDLVFSPGQPTDAPLQVKARPAATVERRRHSH